MASPKNEKITVLLAVLPGVIGFLGIGHLYVGRIRRGFILLISAWGLVSTSVFCFIAYLMSHMVIPPPGQPIPEVPAYVLVFLVIGFVLFLGAVALWIWQIFDARAVCRSYNKQVSG